jgi:hypothetical protein
LKQELKDFSLRLLIITAALAAVGALLFIFVIPEYYFKAFPLSFIVFFAVSFLSHRSLLKALEKSQAQFNNTFMLTFLIKLFAYTAFAAVVLIFSEENKKAFAVCLLILYTVYTSYDIKHILSAMRKS